MARVFLFAVLYLLLIIWIQAAVADTAYASQASQKSGDATDRSSSATTRESSQFKSPRWSSYFRFPELPTPRPISVPGLTALRESTSNSFSQAKRSSRRWWTRTKELLSPFDSDSESEQLSSETTSEGGRWFSWLWPQPEEPEIQTVNDFLRQERPKF